jgi:hypothetical protein
MNGLFFFAFLRCSFFEDDESCVYFTGLKGFRQIQYKKTARRVAKRIHLALKRNISRIKLKLTVSLQNVSQIYASNDHHRERTFIPEHNSKER